MTYEETSPLGSRSEQVTSLGEFLGLQPMGVYIKREEAMKATGADTYGDFLARLNDYRSSRQEEAVQVHSIRSTEGLVLLSPDHFNEAGAAYVYGLVEGITGINEDDLWAGYTENQDKWEARGIPAAMGLDNLTPQDLSVLDTLLHTVQPTRDQNENGIPTLSTVFRGPVNVSFIANLLQDGGFHEYVGREPRDLAGESVNARHCSDLLEDFDMRCQAIGRAGQSGQEWTIIGLIHQNPK